MPPLSIQWLRGSRDASTSSFDRLTPAQRAVRVLQVTRANWPMSEGRRAKRQMVAGVAVEPLVRLGQPHFGV